MKKNQPLSAPSIKLSAKPGDSEESEIEVIREGVYKHPFYGKMDINKAFLNSLVLNFQGNALRKEIALDYGHKWDEEAAGWFKSLSLGSDEKGKTVLLAKVKYTKTGKQKVEDEDFKYISADFTDNYIDNETDQEFGPTLFGAGLTNSPFIKGMSSVQLSEFNEGEEEMFKNLEEANAKVEELQKKLNDLTPGHKLLADKGLDAEKAVKKIEELTSKVEEADKAKKLAEKKSQFQKLLADKKAVPAQEEAFMSGDLSKFAELGSSIKLNEKPAGSSAEPEHDGDLDEVERRAKVDELIQKKLSEFKGTARDKQAAYSKMYLEVKKENPELFQ